MELRAGGASIWCYDGGRTFDPAQPTVVFIHGVLNDHSVWSLQSRYLAHHGFNVLALDLPGHCRSTGEPPRSVEQGADSIIALLDAAAIERAALVGHSFGSLIALEAAARAADRITHLALLGSACPMRVAPALLDASLDDPASAIALVNAFSHSTLAPPPSSLGPGTWLYGAARALMQRVLASNREVNLLHTGFSACNEYLGGETAAGKLRCRVLFIGGRKDRMTPPRAAQPLIDRASQAKVVLLDAGHSLMSEAPDEVLFALDQWLRC